MSVPRSDSLLLSVNGDYFRKFIKMAAGYNTLNDFLGKMDPENAITTMKAFVIRLETTDGLEQAVDVADSYSSVFKAISGFKTDHKSFHCSDRIFRVHLP